MAGYLAYFALGAAALTFLITRDMRAPISLIVVAGACSIAAGTPLAILGVIGRVARLGAIIKGGVHLETLGRVVFDKTGTLTVGKPDVQQIVPAAEASSDEILAAAAAAELRSEHPLGNAIVACARTQSATSQNRSVSPAPQDAASSRGWTIPSFSSEVGSGLHIDPVTTSSAV